MMENQASRELIEKLASVDSKLEELRYLLAEQASASSKDIEIEERSFVDDIPPEPVPTRISISATEAETIFQKVERINHDAEMLERVEKLERQNRKITILVSISRHHCQPRPRAAADPGLCGGGVNFCGSHGPISEHRAS